MEKQFWCLAGVSFRRWIRKKDVNGGQKNEGPASASVGKRKFEGKIHERLIEQRVRV
jgi:hypothetical protein